MLVWQQTEGMLQEAEGSSSSAATGDVARGDAQNVITYTNDKKILKLDKQFNNIEKVTNDTLFFKGKDVLVQSTWELPIVVQLPGSRIHFEFTSSMGDIMFGIVFVAAADEGESDEDMQTEVIDEMGRVLSHEQAYFGSFEPRSEGVVFFVWDNTHDWYSNKNISYTIEMQQVSHHTFTCCCIVYVLLSDMIEMLSCLCAADIYFARHGTTRKSPQAFA